MDHEIHSDDLRLQLQVYNFTQTLGVMPDCTWRRSLDIFLASLIGGTMALISSADNDPNSVPSISSVGVY